MNIKELRTKTGLSQRKFGERLGLQGQSILLYEKEERKVPESVQRLIRYEFAKYLPEQERLYPYGSPEKESLSPEEIEEYKNLKQELATARATAQKAESLEQMIAMQHKTIALLEDQIQLYKDRLNIVDDKSKTA